MRDPRRFGAKVYETLKDKTAEFVKRGFGAQKIAAAETRVGQSTISDYGVWSGGGADEMFMPVDVLADLLSASGDTTLLDHLAAFADCLVVQLPRGEPDELTERTILTSQDYSAMVGEVLASYGDKQLSPAEARAILSKIRTLMLDLASMAETVRSLAREGER